MDRRRMAWAFSAASLLLAACASGAAEGVQPSSPTPTPPPPPISVPTSEPASTPVPTPWLPLQTAWRCEPTGARTCQALYVLADSYDDEHVIRTDGILEGAGYSKVVASDTLEEIRGFHECYGFTPAYPDLLLADVDVADYDVILFAGTDGASTDIHNDPEAHRIAQEAFGRGLVVAAVGDGPVILAKAGVLPGRTLTVLHDAPWHGISDQWIRAIERGGGAFVDSSLWRDGLLITADFARNDLAWAILEVLGERSP